jgi:hypothetical protein
MRIYAVPLPCVLLLQPIKSVPKHSINYGSALACLTKTTVLVTRNFGDGQCFLTGKKSLDTVCIIYVVFK